MALTFTKRYSGRLDRKKLKIYDVTHDGSETSIDCTDLELNYIDHAMASGATIPVGSAGTTAYPDLTTNNGLLLAMSALSSGAITTIWAIGT